VSRTFFTARPPSSPYESYTKQKKKKEAKAEDVDIGRKWLGYLIIKMMFNLSALANCKKEKGKKK
jgi:hypothetical protein